MALVKRFSVLGEPIEVLLTGEMSNGALAVIGQICDPGGGPPPHRHINEDEIFTVLEGQFEVFDGTQWHPLARGETAFGPRGGIHTFRNSGTTVGTMQVVISPAGLETYLEQISNLAIPRDMERLLEISRSFGVTILA